MTTGEVIVLTAVNILAWLVIHLSLPWIFTRMPAAWFRPGGWLFRPRRWEGEGRSPFLESGSVDPAFVDDVIARAPAAARAFTVGQAKASIPAGQQLPLAGTIALGAALPQAAAPAAPAQTTANASQDAAYDPALFERLRTWRREEAERRGKAAFHVFPDATLQRIAAARPQTEEELLAVKGVGAKKLEQFGPAVLGVVNAEPKEEKTT